MGARHRQDVIGEIELELVKLVRHLDTFGRRGSFSVKPELDRAGYLALRTLDEVGPSSTAALARALYLDSSTLTRQLAALEGSGLVERLPNPADRRSWRCVLTVRGHQVLGRERQRRRQAIEGLVQGWGAAETAGLGEALSRLNRSLARSVTGVTSVTSVTGVTPT